MSTNIDKKEINPILSVCIPTFNQEEYIAQALDSVLMQKTQYKFEVLVGEDCSTDNTRSILKQYEKDHPCFFTMFYREKNMSSLQVTNCGDLKQRSCGKYIIVLEGDDYWTDPYKVEKQVSFLEENPEYYAVAHNCVVVDENSNPNGEVYPECKDNEYTYKHYFSEILPGQTTTVMYRNYLVDKSFLSLQSPTPKGTPGDRRIFYSLIVNGRVYCLQECMSAYRHVTTGDISFSSRYKYNLDAWIKWFQGMIKYTQDSKPEWTKYMKSRFIARILIGYKQNIISANEVLTVFVENHLFSAVPIYLYGIIRNRVFKCKLWI